MAGIDLLSAVIGFVVGSLLVAFVVETMGRSRTQTREDAKLTSAWRISELGKDALIVTRDVLDVDVPAGARIVAAGIVDPAVFQACKVRQVADVPGEYAVSADGQKALLFLAGARRGSLALVTTDETTLARLKADGESLWTRADPYVERTAIGQLGGRTGINVETIGIAQEVLPYSNRHIIRLADGGDIIGVLVDKDPTELVGHELLVRGRLEKDRSGFPVIAATDLRRMQ